MQAIQEAFEFSNVGPYGNNSRPRRHVLFRNYYELIIVIIILSNFTVLCSDSLLAYTVVKRTEQ